MTREYRVYLDDALLTKTDWPPRAQAAWHRATRDRDASHHDSKVVLMIDGRPAFSAPAQRGRLTPWPVPDEHEASLRDVAHAVLLLARTAGASAASIAEEMTRAGLETNPARLKSITSMEPGRRTATSEAELVTICYAAVGVLKKAQDDAA